MTDQIDLANERAAAFVENHLQAQRGKLAALQGQAGALTASHCFDCGDEIPEARRQAVKGCMRCIDCQSDFEKR